MLTRVAHLTIRYRWMVISCWLVLAVLGGLAAGKVSTRWYQSFSIPGQPAYQAGQRTLAAFGAGVRPPAAWAAPAMLQLRRKAPQGSRLAVWVNIV